VLCTPSLIHYDHENHDFDFGVQGVEGVVGVCAAGVDEEDPASTAS
jgi:hypothetical protein